MRVVLDTNVLVRATLSPSGPAAELVEIIQSQRHSLVVSEFILTELNRVLSYPRLVALHRFDDAAIASWVAGLRAISVVVNIGDAVRFIADDPDDDPVIATATTGQADYLCSRDRHLHHKAVHDHCAEFGVRVVTELELLAELRPSA